MGKAGWSHSQLLPVSKLHLSESPADTTTLSSPSETGKDGASTLVHTNNSARAETSSRLSAFQAHLNHRPQQKGEEECLGGSEA